jgi:hypothetical protein
MPISALNRGAVDGEVPTQPASGAPAVASQRAPRSGLFTRKRWKWLRRGAFVLIMVLAVTLYLKQRAMERELQQRAAQPGLLSAELRRQAAQRGEAADADRGAGLNRDEMAIRLPRFAGRFDEMDLNRDGVVSRRELEQFLEKDGVTQDMRKVDTAAAPVTTSQADAAPAPIAVAPPVAPAPVEPKPASAPDAPGDIPIAIKKEFIAADRDGNGYLSPDEVRGRFPAVEKNFSEVDTNRDGRISLEELWEFRRKMFAGRLRQP